METTGIGSTSQAVAASGSSAKELSDQFMHLLVAQLKNQDPLNPMENQDFVSELAQLQTLEQQTELAKSNESLLLQTSLATGASIIGKSVEGFVTSNGERVSASGVVESIRVEAGQVQYRINTGSSVETMSPSDLVSIVETPST